MAQRNFVSNLQPSVPCDWKSTRHVSSIDQLPQNDEIRPEDHAFRPLVASVVHVGAHGAHAHAIGGELIEEIADVLMGGVEPRVVVHLVEKSECSDGILISLRFNLTHSPLSFNITLVQRQSFAHRGQVAFSTFGCV